MGLTYIEASIANPARPRRRARLKFLVDSGALYSVVPAPVLRRLGIKPGKTKSFILADGTEIKRSPERHGFALTVRRARLRSSSARRVIAFCSAVFRWRFWASCSIPSSVNSDPCPCYWPRSVASRPCSAVPTHDSTNRTEKACGDHPDTPGRDGDQSSRRAATTARGASAAHPRAARYGHRHGH